MPKRHSNGKQPQFLRFRPYHAFTTAEERSRESWRKIVWRIIWVIAVIALLFIATFIFLQSR